MKDKFKRLVSELEPYCILNKKNQFKMKNKVSEISISEENIFDPLSLSSQNFIERIYKMDEMTFGGQGMGMQRWVFFDCSVMPGFVFGFAIKAHKLSSSDQQRLAVNGNELVPVSMYIAIPMIESQGWFGHNLSSLNGLIDYDLSGLGLLTKIVALEFFDIKHLVGATQWNSKALLIHHRVGKLKIRSALTPIHSKLETLCYSCEVDSIDNVLSKQFNPVEGALFDPTLENLRSLQQKIELGEEKEIKAVIFKDFKLQVFI